VNQHAGEPRIEQPAIISGHTKVCAVIGDPVRHSLSPTLHNAAFAATGIDAVYVALPVAASMGAAAIDAMRTFNIMGMSVTMPHKLVVAQHVDFLTPQARSLESCNTLFRDPDDPGRIGGDSTDGEGCIRGLIDHGVTISGARVVVLGAGGAGRAVIDALDRHGAADISVLNRDRDRAGRVAALVPAARVGDPDDVLDAAILINATSVGMRADDELPIAQHLLHDKLVVNDLIYSPLTTALLQAASRVGATTINGLPMLMHQAALQFERWTGTPAPLQVMRDVLTRELQQRSA
jgi:shikimate dehydrogenase